MKKLFSILIISVIQPRLTVSYHQKGSIQIHDKHHNIELTVIAKKS